MRRSAWWLWWTIGCAPEDVAAPNAWQVTDFAAVVPSTGLPPEVSPNAANNNLDVDLFDGRWWLAFRTADTHFAGPEARMVVISSADQVDWRYEGEIAIGTDVREPQLVRIDGVLWLYFTRLGDNALAFEPGGVMRARYEGAGAWSEPAPVFEDGFLAWRIKWLDGRLVAFGYQGGENVYQTDGDPTLVQWLASEDGETWAPAYGADPTVLSNGASESDGVFLPDGRLVAVVRNEKGSPNGEFGSYVCVAPAGDPMAWDCRADARKFDSPLVFVEDGRAWLIARRNLTGDGRYDLDQDELSYEQQYLSYQLAYWQEPKRCALWEISPDTRSVAWVLDLPSKGDTCFPEAVRTEAGWVVYNYSNDPEGPELSWLEGQTGETGIYRQTLRWGPGEEAGYVR